MINGIFYRHRSNINNTSALDTLNQWLDGDSVFVKRNRCLLCTLGTQIPDDQNEDSNCQLIDPQFASIQRNDDLLDWGYQIVDGSMPRQTFNHVLRRSVPSTGFLQLAENLEIKTSIRTMHKPLASEPTVAAA